MRKRVMWFVISLAAVIGLNIVMPLMGRMSSESTSLNTSMSVSPYGFKALHLLLGRVDDQPVALWQRSLMSLSPENPRTVWMMEPGKGMFHDGDVYGDHMRKLVESGYNFVFVLDSRKLENEQDLFDVLDYVNEWFDLQVGIEVVSDIEVTDLVVESHFASREIGHLSYRPIDENVAAKFKAYKGEADRDPELTGFDPDSIRGGEILLETVGGDPLMVRFPIGKGSVTIFPNAYFFGNMQLDKGENAALAVAIQEANPASATLFEVYSLGFNANRDIITYLATGKGVVLLATLTLMLLGYCLWMLLMPVRKKYYLDTSNERYFTQEVFISALADHYTGTGNWTQLYDKLRDQFKRELDQIYPGLPLEEQLRRVADSPFYDVSFDALKAAFDIMDVASEKDFIAKSQNLLELQRKVGRHEQYQPGAVSHAAPAPVVSQADIPVDLRS